MVFLKEQNLLIQYCLNDTQTYINEYNNRELVFNSFYFGNMCGLERTDDFTVDTVCRCGVPERTVY